MHRYNWYRLLFAIALCSATAACSNPEITINASKTTSASSHIINHDHLDEISGLASSRNDPKLLWVHNDSGDDARTYAVTTTGQYRGSVTLNNVQANDWEDMASFSLNDINYLIVGDIGDNRASRSSIQFYVIEEPDISQLGDHFSIGATVAWSFSATYPDGPRDVEGLAVDTREQAIYLLSKRDKPPRLYRLPLKPNAANVTATFITTINTINTIPQPTEQDIQDDPRYGKFRYRPTALDISPAGDSMIITTYKDSYYYKRHTHQKWLQALQQPIIINTPQLRKTEAGGLSYDAQSIFIASEQLPATLAEVKIAP